MSTPIEIEKMKAATDLKWLDKLSYVGLLGGATASVITQQAAFATVPFSLILAAQIFSRNQKISALVEANQQNHQSVQMVGQTLDALTQKVEQTFQEQENTLDHLTQENNRHNLESITIKERLDEQAKTIAELAGQLDVLDTTLINIKEITAVSNLDSHAASAESHFTRGTHQEKLGHLAVAIEDYSQAIARSPNYAEAYLRRGLAKTELGRKQSAIIDLNLATKHFFEAGDLRNYQRAKDISTNIHAMGTLASNMEGSEDGSDGNSALVSINGLFG